MYNFKIITCHPVTEVLYLGCSYYRVTSLYWPPMERPFQICYICCIKIAARCSCGCHSSLKAPLYMHIKTCLGWSQHLVPQLFLQRRTCIGQPIEQNELPFEQHTESHENRPCITLSTSSCYTKFEADLRKPNLREATKLESM